MFIKCRDKAADFLPDCFVGWLLLFSQGVLVEDAIDRVDKKALWRVNRQFAGLILLLPQELHCSVENLDERCQLLTLQENHSLHAATATMFHHWNLTAALKLFAEEIDVEHDLRSVGWPDTSVERVWFFITKEVV